MKHKVGVIGCGVISETYLSNIKNIFFSDLEVAACADRRIEKAENSAKKFGVPKYCSIDELLSDPEIEIVLNLTVPEVHFEINKKALLNGKHVYCEKPLALSAKEAEETATLAKEKDLLVCCAPDTFLGAGLQTCRSIIDKGLIGVPLAATANMVNHGPEIWHTSPEFYYRFGGGPLFDMGPYYLTALVSLLGQIKSAMCLAGRSADLREIYSQPKKGELMPVDVFTSYSSVLKFSCGVIANINMSFDVWRSTLPKLEIYGTEGTLVLPDPNFFGGKVKLMKKAHMLENIGKVHFGNDDIYNDEFYEEVPPVFSQASDNMRGIGLYDMANALENGEKPRASIDLAYHVTEAMLGVELSAKEGKVYDLISSVDRPKPMY